MIGLESGCVFCNPITRLLLMLNFCPLKYGIFHGIPVKDSGGATVEDTQVVVGCLKKSKFTAGSVQKRTRIVYTMPILRIK